MEGGFGFGGAFLIESYSSVSHTFLIYLIAITAIYKTQNILELVSKCSNMTDLFAYTAW